MKVQCCYTKQEQNISTRSGLCRERCGSSLLTGDKKLGRLSVFSQLLVGRSPRWEQISLFMGDATPREEVSEEDKRKDKSSGRHLIFTTDKQTAGEGFLWAGDGDFLFFSSLFPPPFWSLLAATEMIVGRQQRQQNEREEVTFMTTNRTDYNLLFINRCIKIMKYMLSFSFFDTEVLYILKEWHENLNIISCLQE